MNGPFLRRSLAVLAAACALVGCAKSPRYASGAGLPAASSGPGQPGNPSEWTVNRGDWLVGDQIGVWKVVAEGEGGKPPETIGYVTARNYREVRGGPTFTLREVTTLDRDDVIGMIDSLGNAYRYLPRRHGGADPQSVGHNTLELSVQAIFGTMRSVTLEATSERKIAFELLDANHDGGITKEEWPSAPAHDRNKDGKVDFNEFDAADRL
jgi:hypothetical protein